jgi:hypothetical protein
MRGYVPSLETIWSRTCTHSPSQSTWAWDANVSRLSSLHCPPNRHFAACIRLQRATYTRLVDYSLKVNNIRKEKEKKAHWIVWLKGYEGSTKVQLGLKLFKFVSNSESHDLVYFSHKFKCPLLRSLFLSLAQWLNDYHDNLKTMAISTLSFVFIFSTAMDDKDRYLL